MTANRYVARDRQCRVCGAPLSVHQQVSGGICNRPQCRWVNGNQQASPREDDGKIGGTHGRRCLVCRAPISVHQQVRGGLCDDPECRRMHTGPKALERQAKRRAARRKLALEHRTQFAETLGVGADSLRIAITPALQPLCQRPSQERREELQALLDQLLLDPALADAPLPSERARDGQAGGASTAALLESLGQACAICKGYCCRMGGNHAYLDVDTIQRVLQDGDAELDDVVGLYLANVPENGVQDSCIFHTERGCALPRQLRSGTCNQYHCEGLNELRNLLVELAGPILVMAVDDDGVHGSCMVGSPAP